MEEGVFHEAMNMSSLMKLPVVFVCLDNGLAVDLEPNARQGFKSIKRIVESYDCKYFHSANVAATDIYKISEKAKAFIIEDHKPVFIHLECYRYLQHIGTNNDFEDSEHIRLLSKFNESGVGFEKKNYRSKDEYEKYLNNKPLDLIRRSARELGLVEDRAWQEFKKSRAAVHKETQKLQRKTIKPQTKEAKKLEEETGEKIRSNKTAYELLKRPQINYKNLVAGNKDLTKNEIDKIEAEVKYEGYIKRQGREIEKLQRNENTPIPTNTSFLKITGLSSEVKQKLEEARPESIARASRLPGVTPAAISLLLVHLKKEATG
jgi:transketolase